MRFENRVALVTGGGQGLGRAISLQFASEGAAVAVVDLNPDTAQSVADEINSANGTAIALQANVVDFEQAEATIKEAIDRLGKLDILVNNAGITRDNLLMRMSEADWDAVLAVNLKSVFNYSKLASKAMMRQRYGRIVSVSSVAGIAGNAGQTNYSASKAGVIGFTKSLAREVASRNVTVNAVAPGFIPTQLTDTVPDEIKEASLKQIPLGRWGTPEDVANAVTFLAQEESGYITGHILSVDGGMVMG
ncbi:MAG: 3-oxoacyl-[acyl-carrier-protein] reductase [Anaerolineae bacterium]|nr:3-oxoacyl-[acyl-carrier-protein] reductase [Anaerolineae bacterium]